MNILKGSCASSNICTCEHPNGKIIITDINIPISTVIIYRTSHVRTYGKGFH